MRLLANAEIGRPKRCPNCDDTGDVHSIDGEWRGTCECPAGQAIKAPQTTQDYIIDLQAERRRIENEIAALQRELDTLPKANNE